MTTRRREAELGLQALVAQHRSVAEELHLLGSALRQAERLQTPQDAREHAGGQGDVGLAQAPRDLSQAEGAVSRQVVDPRTALADALDDGARHVLVPDQHERRVGAADPHHDRPLEHGRDGTRNLLPQDRPGTEDQLRQLGVLAAGAFEHLLDQALVVGVRELLVSPQRVGLAQKRGVVGVVAVGGAAAGVDEAANPGAQGGLDDVARPLHIDRVLELARALLRGRHDGGEVDDGVGAVASKRLREFGIPDVPGAVLDPGPPLRLGDLAQIHRDDSVDAAAVAGEDFHHAAAHEPRRPRDQNRVGPQAGRLAHVALLHHRSAIARARGLTPPAPGAWP
jgi:hypothetical protein